MTETTEKLMVKGYRDPIINIIWALRRDEYMVLNPYIIHKKRRRYPRMRVLSFKEPLCLYRESQNRKNICCLAL